MQMNVISCQRVTRILSTAIFLLPFVTRKRPVSNLISRIWYLPHGLALDVLPLDYYPKNPAGAKKQVRWALIYSLFVRKLFQKNMVHL